MLKVLIADDEVIICQMLKKLINWEDKNMEIIGIAHNGIEAENMILSLKPDIVISDVRMPGIDGLRLIEKTKELGFEIDYIVMSGYKHFEYAYTALNLGVIYYLLKPIDALELEEILDRIIKSRNEKLEEQQEKEELKQTVKEASDRIRKYFLNDIINMYGIQLENGDLELEKDFSNECFLSFFIKIDQTHSEENIVSLLDVVIYNIEKYMEKGAWEYINSYVKSGVVTVVNYQKESKKKLLQTIEDIKMVCQKEMQKFHGLYIVVGIGSEKNSLSQVKISIEEAIEAIQARIKLGTDNIIYFNKLTFKYVDISEILCEKDIRALKNEIDALDQVAFLKHIDQMVKRVTEEENYSPSSLYELLEKIEELSFEQFRNNKILEEVYEEEYKERFQLIYDNNFKENLLVYRYKENMRQLFNDAIEEHRDKTQKPIRLAEQYIQKYFNQPITLEQVAEAIGLSGAYLSTMFKKEKGINFIEYLIAYRMEKAKELLKETNYTVNIVAEKVGYTDGKYFSKTFSKFVGLKPTEYRKLYG